VTWKTLVGCEPRWEDNIKMNLRRFVFGGMDWIHSSRLLPWWNKDIGDLNIQTRKLFNNAKKGSLEEVTYPL
jgi:hypothetical protein